MGQYFLIANIDKWEYFSARDLGGFVELMEWSYKDNECVNAMLSLMSGKWKGDRVYVVGDYAECDNPEDTFYNTLESVEEELGFKGEYK